MNYDERLRNAVLSVVPICEPHAYQQEAEEYCVYDYVMVPAAYADGNPMATQYVTQLNWYLQPKRSPWPHRRQLLEALAAAGFPAPEILDYSDDLSQHYVFTWTAVEWGNHYGQ